MKKTIAVLPGDGIGPEVVAEGLKVLEAMGLASGHDFVCHEAPAGGIAIDLTGQALPKETLSLCKRSDAVLLGAVGGPKWDDPRASVRPEQALLGLRGGLGLYANLRPVKAIPVLFEASPLKPEVLAGTDIMVVRELTGGLYFGKPSRRTPYKGYVRAVDTMAYTDLEIARIVRQGFQLARRRRGHLTSVDKFNILTTGRLWREVATRIGREEFPDVVLEHMLVDACAMHLLRAPSRFDVIVTENTFGDILTDEASMLAGSMGLLPSASLGEASATGTRGLYEPIHGTAPDIAGQGIANPLAAILSVALMLRHSFGLEGEAAAIEDAVDAVLAEGYRTADLYREGEGNRLAGTREMGDRVVEHLAITAPRIPAGVTGG
jgi:3-isopropylmalate dehydrogenase